MNLVLGDCLEVMKSFPLSSIDALVTDPPYGFGFMGKKWDYDLPSIEIWKECLRVLKPGAHLLSFGGPRTYHRMACGVEDAGFEIRDQLQWLFGSGFPKSLNCGEGRGTALKPANEPILLARKPLSEKTVKANLEKWGTGTLNIDGCRVGTETIAQHQRDLSQAHGNKWAAGTKQPVLGVTNYTIGRFPANVILDEAAGAMLDERSGVTPSNSRKNKGEFAGYGHGKLKNRPPYSLADSPGGASRFFYVAKASRSERNAGCDGIEPRYNDFQRESSGLSQGKNPTTGERSGNRIAPASNHHPTVKPVKLMRYLCRLITPPKGTVLDPFMGSGTTGVAALQEGFEFVGIEKEPQYFEIAKARIENAKIWG